LYFQTCIYYLLEKKEEKNDLGEFRLAALFCYLRKREAGGVIMVSSRSDTAWPSSLHEIIQSCQPKSSLAKEEKKITTISGLKNQPSEKNVITSLRALSSDKSFESVLKPSLIFIRKVELAPKTNSILDEISTWPISLIRVSH